jgi:hypothetical protein
MVTIHNLEVFFDVDGHDEEKIFADLFNKYIREWNRRHDEEQRIQKDSVLGDRGGPEEY